MNMTDHELDTLYATLQARKKADPDSSYVARLHAQGLDAILKKLGEESVEVLLAAKGTDTPALVHELADLWFHSLVLMSAKDIAPGDVLAELSRRKGRSGLDEKAARHKSP